MTLCIIAPLVILWCQLPAISHTIYPKNTADSTAPSHRAIVSFVYAKNHSRTILPIITARSI